jgi:hypothetical protein
LVNADNPWGKYVSSDPDNDKEVLASYWYIKNYNECPNTQFLLCLEACMDKTTKNAGLTSYAGEPCLLSVLHLKKLSANLQVHGLCRPTFPTWKLVYPQRSSSTFIDT